LEFSGNLRFSGSWKGVIRAFVQDSHLFVRGGAQIQGRIQAPQITIEGSLQDIEIFAERVRILAGAHIQGRVTARAIILEEGAIVEGRIRVEKNLKFSASDRPQMDNSFSG
jgi:cytoskeletal protein CcmA (bactofilin family)